MTAWVPDGETMRQKGIIADLVRAPDRLDNRIFEFALLTANHGMTAGNYQLADFILGVINDALEIFVK